eukprot:435817-Rhodomonas_salina.2
MAGNSVAASGKDAPEAGGNYPRRSCHDQNRPPTSFPYRFCNVSSDTNLPYEQRNKSENRWHHGSDAVTQSAPSQSHPT